MAGVAHMKAHNGRLEEALALLALVKVHPASHYESRRRAERLWEELAAELPAEFVLAAEAKGQQLDLMETAVSLLAEASITESTPALDRKTEKAETLNLRFTVGQMLAAGGHGQVYRGEDTHSGQPVVIKQLKPELQAQEDLVARFLCESETLRQLNHPNIVQMVDAFELNGRHAIVMEYVPGAPCVTYLSKKASSPKSTDAKIIAAGLILGGPADMSPEALLVRS